MKRYGVKAKRYGVKIKRHHKTRIRTHDCVMIGVSIINYIESLKSKHIYDAYATDIYIDICRWLRNSRRFPKRKPLRKLIRELSRLLIEVYKKVCSC